MQYRNLGKSGLKVSTLSLGSWITFNHQVDEKLAMELMALAYERGVNFFDNAEVYAHGRSEYIMGNALKTLAWDRSSYLVSSKAYFGRGDKRPNMTGLSRKHLTEACNEALQRLQLEYLDLFFAHRPDRSTPIEETVWTMHQLIMQGKILYWGTSEWSAQEITEAHLVARQNHLIGPVMEQVQYNMLTRYKVECEYSQLFKTLGLGTTTWSPLCSGLLTAKYLGNRIPEASRFSYQEYAWLRERNLVPEKIAKVERLNALAQGYGIPLNRMAIAWCLKNPNVSSVILGATSVSQLADNLASVNLLPLFDDQLSKAIEDILQNAPAPFE
ncbi:MAG: aldo/keto reductase [Saprospiraceae bacterium]|nr:aldo/keto reductase [Saprospiraceae bacterium]